MLGLCLVLRNCWYCEGGGKGWLSFEIVLHVHMDSCCGRSMGFHTRNRSLFYRHAHAHSRYAEIGRQPGLIYEKSNPTGQ